MKEISPKSLASRLLYLPLDVHEKVLLWLTYKGLKPVSEITVLKRNRTHLRRMMSDPEYRSSYKSPYSYDSKKSKRIRHWISDAGLHLSIEPGHDTAWHISLDPDLAKQSTELLHKFDTQSETKSGILFGFPKESAKAYAENRNKSDEDVEKIMVGTGELLYKNSFLKDKYYTPYIFYNMPKDKVQEESKIAKNWADAIRQDVPKLATWLEKKARSNN